MWDYERVLPQLLLHLPSVHPALAPADHRPDRSARTPPLLPGTAHASAIELTTHFFHRFHFGPLVRFVYVFMFSTHRFFPLLATVFYLCTCSCSGGGRDPGQ